MHRMKSLGWWRAVTSMLLACTLGGVIFSACGGQSSSLGNPVVPGRAALTVKAGTPAICSQLVHSAAIRGISTDLTGLTQSPPPQPAVEGLRNAASEFRALANRAPVALQTELLTAASASTA